MFNVNGKVRKEKNDYLQQRLSVKIFDSSLIYVLVSSFLNIFSKLSLIVFYAVKISALPTY